MTLEFLLDSSKKEPNPQFFSHGKWIPHAEYNRSTWKGRNGIKNRSQNFIHKFNDISHRVAWIIFAGLFPAQNIYDNGPHVLG